VQAFRSLRSCRAGASFPRRARVRPHRAKSRRLRHRRCRPWSWRRPIRPSHSRPCRRFHRLQSSLADPRCSAPADRPRRATLLPCRSSELRRRPRSLSDPASCLARSSVARACRRGTLKRRSKSRCLCGSAAGRCARASCAGSGPFASDPLENAPAAGSSHEARRPLPRTERASCLLTVRYPVGEGATALWRYFGEPGTLAPPAQSESVGNVSHFPGTWHAKS
jgi:hypothetical protein